MTANGSGPASVATEVEALATDLLDSTIDTKSNTATSTAQGDNWRQVAAAVVDKVRPSRAP
jgi:hypothetical protein